MSNIEKRLQSSISFDAIHGTNEEVSICRGQMIEAVHEIKQLRADNERLKAFIADKIHDATREQMMMEIDYKGVECE